MKNRCEERIDECLKGRIKDFTLALQGKYSEAYGDETAVFEDFIDFINSYSLQFDDDPVYRAKRLLLSTGGPEDYFLFFERNDTIVYCYKDWFDSAERTLSGVDYVIMRQVRDRLDF